MISPPDIAGRRVCPSQTGCWQAAPWLRRSPELRGPTAAVHDSAGEAAHLLQLQAGPRVLHHLRAAMRGTDQPIYIFPIFMFFSPFEMSMLYKSDMGKCIQYLPRPSTTNSARPRMISNVRQPTITNARLTTRRGIGLDYWRWFWKCFWNSSSKKCSWLLTFWKSFSKSGWESISINTVMEVGTCPFSNIHLKKIYKIIFNNLIKLHQAKNHFEYNWETQ